MPQLFSLPSIRRSTFRAPDPAEHLADERGARAHDVRREPRHRADRVGNRRPSSGGRRIVALGCATAILGGSVFGTVAASAKDGDGASLVASNSSAGGEASDAMSTAPADELVSRIGDDPEPVVTSELSTAAVPFTGGTEVTVQGELLDEVAAVTVGGVTAPIVSATPASVTFTVPAVDDETRGDVPVAFTDAAGRPIDVEVPVASSPAVEAAAPVAPAFTAAPAATGTGAADVPTVDALSLTYTDDERINAQVGYVLAHWNDYNTAEYTVLSGVDCANFTSQSLVARGWQMDAAWYYDRATGAMGAAWSSSTAMRDWLRSRPDLATPLDDAQRSAVKVGDIAQFDWDGSGDRDHTTVVTRVETTATGTKVWVGGHTKDSDYWDVDEALVSSGGTVSYFSLS